MMKLWSWVSDRRWPLLVFNAAWLVMVFWVMPHLPIWVQGTVYLAVFGGLGYSLGLMTGHRRQLLIQMADEEKFAAVMRQIMEVTDFAKHMGEHAPEVKDGTNEIH